MKIYFSRNFTKKASKLVKKNPQLKLKLAKQISLFKENSGHRSLKLHRLKGRRSDQYSIWIEGDLRALFIQEGDEFVFVNLINHDEY
jgi:toxin HigB-1